MLGFFTSKLFLIPAAIGAAAMVAFLSVNLMIAQSEAKNFKKKIEVMELHVTELTVSNTHMQGAIGGLENDKLALQQKLKRTEQSAKSANLAAAESAAEATKISELIRVIRETQNETDSTFRVRSLSVDWLRDRQAAASAGDPG